MRAEVWSLLTTVDASGPDMDRAETVTLFNGLCRAGGRAARRPFGMDLFVGGGARPPDLSGGHAAVAPGNWRGCWGAAAAGRCESGAAIR